MLYEDQHLKLVPRRCLEKDPEKRATVQQLLNHPYLRQIGFFYNDFVITRTFSDRFTLSCCPCQSAVCASPLRWAEIKSLYATLDHSYIVWSNTSLLHSYILTVLGQIPPFISLLIFPIKRAMVRLSKRREKKEENQPTWFCCNIGTLLLLRFRKK